MLFLKVESAQKYLAIHGKIVVALKAFTLYFAKSEVVLSGNEFYIN